MQDAPVAWWRLDDPVGSTFSVDQLGQQRAAVTGDDVVFGVDGAVGSAVMLSANGYPDVGDYFRSTTKRSPSSESARTTRPARTTRDACRSLVSAQA